MEFLPNAVRDKKYLKKSRFCLEGKMWQQRQNHKKITPQTTKESSKTQKKEKIDNLLGGWGRGKVVEGNGGLEERPARRRKEVASWRFLRKYTWGNTDARPPPA